MNLLDLMVEIGVDDRASGQIGGIASDIKGKLGGAAKFAAGAMAAGVSAAGAAVGAIGKQSLDAYASFEQLEGGIDKLFGTGGKNLEEYAAAVGQSVEQAAGKFDALNEAHELVMANAQRAYATAGMSANEYMENVSGFAAALTNSLGGDTVKAAHQADVAMRAISDNVNTFGSDMGSVTMAFQGFAKQNYTMLDNLKLGYGGTKTEMERLIADANEWGAANGKASDLSIESFSDVVTAIQQIQEKQQIAGTTAKEAAKTIEGSVNATKAAWTNLLTELGKEDGDIGARIEELAESAGNVVDNVVPRITQIGQGLADALPTLVPKVFELGASLIGSVGEGLITAVPSLLTSLGDSFGMVVENIATAIANGRERMFQAAADMMDGLTEAIQSGEFAEGVRQTFEQITEQVSTYLAGMFQGDGLQQMLDAAMGLFSAIGTMVSENLPGIFESLGAMIGEALPGLVETIFAFLSEFGGTILNSVLEFLPTLIDALVGFVTSLVGALVENAPQMFDAAVGFFNTMLDALVQNLPTILDGLVQGLLSLVDMVIQNGPELLVAAGEFFLNILTSLVENLPQILEGLYNALGDLIAGIIERIPDILAAAFEFWMGLNQAIADALPDILAGLGDLLLQAISSIGDFNGDMLEAGWNLIQGLIDGIMNSIGGVKDAILGGLEDAVQGAMDFLGIASPSKLFKELGGFTMEGMAIGIDADATKAEQAMRAAADAVYGAASGTVDLGVTATGTGSQTPPINIVIENFVNNTEEDVRTLSTRIGEYTDIEMKMRGYYGNKLGVA